MITTHVLDTAQGRPASGIAVRLELKDGQSWTVVGQGATDADGRLKTLNPKARPGSYRLIFDTRSRSTFFPEITVQFEITDTTAHYHVPLLLSPFGYSTYRGS